MTRPVAHSSFSLRKRAPSGRRRAGFHPNPAPPWLGGPGRLFSSAYRVGEEGSQICPGKDGRRARTLAADLPSRVAATSRNLFGEAQNAYFAESLLWCVGACCSENSQEASMSWDIWSQALPRPISPISGPCTSGPPPAGEGAPWLSLPSTSTRPVGFWGPAQSPRWRIFLRAVLYNFFRGRWELYLFHSFLFDFNFYATLNLGGVSGVEEGQRFKEKLIEDKSFFFVFSGHLSPFPIPIPVRTQFTPATEI